MNSFPFDITDVAAVLGLTLNSRNYTDCPICGDNRGKMNLNLEKNVFRCNHCGESGGMIALYAKVYGLSNADAYRSLLEATGNGDFSVQKREYKKACIARETVQRAGRHEISRTYNALLSMFALSAGHRENLTVRGLTDEQIEWFGFRSTPVCELDRYMMMLTARVIR